MNAAEDRRRAGIFLLSSLGLLLLVAGTLAGVRLLSRESKYVVEFRESVAGLEISGPVKYNGVPVGKVAGIRFHPTDTEKILVDISVRPEVPVRMDTRAQLKPQGITGIFYLELYSGSGVAPRLEEGDPIPSDPSFSTKIGNIATDLSELLAALNRFVQKNEENLSYAIADFRASAGSIRDTLAKVDRLVEDAAKGVGEAREGLADLRAEIRAAGDGVRRSLAEVEAILKDPALRGLAAKASGTLDLANEKLAAADTAGISAKMREVLDRFLKVEESMERAGTAVAALAERGREDVTAVLADIRDATANVKALTRALREDPGRVLRANPASDKPFPDPLPPPPEGPR